MQAENNPVDSCPSCVGVGYEVWGIRDEHEILDCQHCRMLYFRRPIVSDHTYQDYYPYLDSFDEKRFDWELKVRRKNYISQFALMRKYVPHAKTHLDVGAGPGYLCKVAHDEGFESQGVEIAEFARVAGEQYFDVDYVKLEDVPDNSVDVITCQHVLEHMEWPQEFLKELHKKLSKNGLLVIHVPNQQPLSYYLRDLLIKNEEVSCAMYYPEHINGFTSESLVNVVEQQKFKVATVFNASMWSCHYDPFFLANYYRNKADWFRSSMRLVKHSLRCSVDVMGNNIGRGDWVIGYFRKL